MNKLSLVLLSSSTIVSSLLLMLLSEQPAQAREADSSLIPEKTQKAPGANLPCARQSCTGNAHLANFVNNLTKNNEIKPLAEDFENLERTPEGHLILEISEEESNAAIEIFGCDCVTSVNALRQMRGIPTGVEGNTIIPGPDIKPCNLPKAPEIGT